MKDRMMKTVITALVAAASFALAGAAAAQDRFPTRPVTLTVGFAPGGGTDTAGRIVAKKLSENIGQPVIVENKAGAGGNIAAQHAATAAPDGYLIHLSSVGPLTVAPHMSKNLPYDPKKDLAPITLGMMFPNVFVVHPSVGARTVAEFVALAKKEPGKLNYASSGIGGAAHLAGELFKQRAGIDLVHVPYKGGGPALADVMGGVVQMTFGNMPTVIAQARGGKVRPIAVTSPERWFTAPDIPAIAETVPGFQAMSWHGVAFPAGTHPAIVNKLSDAIQKAMATGEVKDKYATGGSRATAMTPEQFAAYIREDTARWAPVIKASGAKVE
jgi:tripartite-type tricarboxylate transporter receptor subunit TctC